MITCRNPFASRTLVEHLARGLGAIALVVFVVWLLSAPTPWRGLVAVLSMIAALILMRGCPMCWLTGLIGTITNPSRKAAHHD
jgi:uncharacterized membrane protein YdbT with pleckstrin-like domain